MIRFKLFEEKKHKHYTVHYRHEKKHKKHHVKAKSEPHAISLFRSYWLGAYPNCSSTPPVTGCTQGDGGTSGDAGGATSA